MRDEPKGELARYAFGYSDKKPGWLFWAIHVGMIAFILWVLLHGGPASAHCFSRWNYKTPQPACLAQCCPSMRNIIGTSSSFCRSQRWTSAHKLLRR
jgi:hypothetical protein